MRIVSFILLLLFPFTALAQSPGSTCETAIDASEPGFTFTEMPAGSRTWYKFSAAAPKCSLSIPPGNSFVLYEHDGNDFCDWLIRKPAQVKMLAKRNITSADAGITLPSFSEEVLNGKCDCNPCTGGRFSEELTLKPGSQYYILLIGQGKDAKIEFIPPVTQGTANKKSAVTKNKEVKTGVSSKSKSVGIEQVERFFSQKKLEELEVGESIMLKTVNFERGITTLLKDSEPDLVRLHSFMKKNPKVKIELSGHVDGSGKISVSEEEEKFALKLSEGRAKAVRDYLVSNGIAASRISSKGYGTSGMVYFGNVENYVKYNRRVEVSILEK